VAFSNGLAYPVFGIAQPKSGTTLNVSMNAPLGGIADGPALNSSAGEKPVPNFRSDVPQRTTPVCDRCEHEQ
jgi:hypothetical protein